ncbi:MAG TPA: ElyC/SanA/YdcF family protein, partial [Verrucomicrobiaceae bacterium]
MPSETDLSIGVLRKMGVPESSIQRFGSAVTTTFDEAVGLRSWLEKHPVQHLVIATDPFHTRRVRFIFTREFKGLPVQISVRAIPTPRFDPLHWWESEEAAVSFQNEVFKLIYYWLRHGTRAQTPAA